MERQVGSYWGIVGAFALGAAAGTVTALLLAPRSGAETRGRLKVVPHAVKEAYSQAKEAGVQAFNRSYAAQGDGGAHPH